jgi:excisionase family DNA binding protein
VVTVNENLITVARAAQICCVTTQTVYRWMKSGELEWAWLGGAKRTSREALDRFMQHGGQTEDKTRHAAVLKDLKERFGIVIGKEERRGRKKEEVRVLQEQAGVVAGPLSSVS